MVPRERQCVFIYPRKVAVRESYTGSCKSAAFACTRTHAYMRHRISFLPHCFFLSYVFLVIFLSAFFLGSLVYRNALCLWFFLFFFYFLGLLSFTSSVFFLMFYLLLRLTSPPSTIPISPVPFYLSLFLHLSLSLFLHLSLSAFLRLSLSLSLSLPSFFRRLSVFHSPSFSVSPSLLLYPSIPPSFFILLSLPPFSASSSRRPT